MQTIDLMQNNFKIPPLVYMVQNDTGRTLKMNIRDNTLEAGDTAEVAINRSDGSYYTISATRVSGENAFSADMTQALTQPGLTKCQLKVTSSSLVVSTYMFGISVEASTDGVPEEQLGVSVQELYEAAQQLTLSDNDVKLALLQIAKKVPYIDEHGQDYYDALEDALYPPVRATSVTLDKASLVFSVLNATDTLIATVSPNNVEDDTVYWGSSDTSVAVVAEGTVLSTGVGSATITAICGTKKATCSVTVASATLTGIEATYTQSGTVYPTTSLDDLKNDLVVVASWSNGTTSIVPSADYTLSGTLALGTSTITVTYGEETDTFSVTVSSPVPSGYTQVEYLNSTANTSTTQSYVNTGIAFDNPSVATLYVDFQENTNSSISAGYAIGMRQKGSTASNNYIGWGIRLVDHTSVGAWSGTPGVQIDNLESYARHKVTATWSSTALTIQEEGGEVHTSTQSTRAIGQYPICLFGIKHVTQATGGTPYVINGKIYSAVAWQDGQKIMELYPCKRDSDSKPGFYDVVNNAFYPPYGSYISAGPEV